MYKTVLKKEDEVFQKPFSSSDKQMPSSGLSELKKIEISPQSDNTEQAGTKNQLIKETHARKQSEEG